MARQKTEGEIGEVKVTVITEGPEAQELEEGEKKKGSDNIHLRITNHINSLKKYIEREPSENECPHCEGDGFFYDGLNEFVECSYCEGEGELVEA